jgi:hypothetical protein
MGVRTGATHALLRERPLTGHVRRNLTRESSPAMMMHLPRVNATLAAARAEFGWVWED